MAKKAIIYTRFSPRRKADESESCQIQEASCRLRAQQKGYEVARVFNDEDISGKDEFREKLWGAIEALTRDSVLLVYKRDRLARNVFLSEQINRAVKLKGARIEAISGDVEGNGPEQTMVRQILAAISEYERKLISLRTSWAMKEHQKRGKRMGRFAPYGWKLGPDDDSKLLEVPEEQEVIEIIRRLHERGVSAEAIKKGLNRRMPEKSRHGKWNRKLIVKIIERL